MKPQVKELRQFMSVFAQKNGIWKDAGGAALYLFYS
jgi:hypothetical protein